MSETQDEARKKRDNARKEYNEYRKMHNQNKSNIERLENEINGIDLCEDTISGYKRRMKNDMCDGITWNGDTRTEFDNKISEICKVLTNSVKKGGIIDNAQDIMIDTKNKLKKLSSDGVLTRLYNALVELENQCEQFFR